MDRLPRDVQLIVWRFLRNDLYDKVVRQFRADYVIYWSDLVGYYMCISRELSIRANWRHFLRAVNVEDRRIKWGGMPIYKIRNEALFISGVDEIPKNY